MNRCDSPGGTRALSQTDLKRMHPTKSKLVAHGTCSPLCSPAASELWPPRPHFPADLSAPGCRTASDSVGNSVEGTSSKGGSSERESSPPPQAALEVVGSLLWSVHLGVVGSRFVHDQDVGRTASRRICRASAGAAWGRMRAQAGDEEHPTILGAAMLQSYTVNIRQVAAPGSAGR